MAKSIFFILLTSIFLSGYGQEKKPLDHDVYDIWNQIKEQHISNDGNWVMYRMGPEDGDDKVIIQHSSDKTIHAYDRGQSAEFSFDSRFAIFKIVPSKTAVKQAKREKKPKDKMPKDSLEIVDLATGETRHFDNVKSFKLPEKNGDWIAVQFEKTEIETDSTSKKTDQKKPPSTGKKTGEKEKAEGTNLILTSLSGETELQYSDVVSYQFSKNGDWLVYAAASNDSTADGIFAVFTGTAERVPLLTGAGDYKHIAFDEVGEQVAFLSNRDDFQSKQSSYTLYHWSIESEQPVALAGEGSNDFPPGWWISEHGELSFSKDGSRLFFGTAPRPAPDADEEVLEEEKVNVDIWHWQDPYLQTMQLIDVEKEQKRTFQAVADLKKDKIAQLGTKEIPELTLGQEGNADIALGISNMPYRQLISWDYPGYYDAYLIDLKTGIAHKIAEKIQAKPMLSPGAKFITWWNRADSNWYTYDIKEKQTRNISAQISQPLYNIIHDWPYEPDGFTPIGWTKNDALFLIYDRYDIWALDPTAKIPPRNLTGGEGRRANLRFRYIRLDPEEKSIDPQKPMLLSAFNYSDKSSGFYQIEFLNNSLPEKLVMKDRFFSKPVKAKAADKLLFTQENVSEFPDLWVSSQDFSDMRKLSNANPQQADYLWTNVELIKWHSLDGVSLEGLLYKPEDFSAANKYPMMVYFYEKNANLLHVHRAPYPHRSVINPVFYASRGYIVFVPDIPYKIGYPGESAVNAVLPGVTNLISQGFVDEENIGVQGHSWGGYQIAYMITRTNIFKAAEAGAPVSNMISAYGGIRWRTGLSRMFQYERTQSRIGGSFWEYPLRFIENSPIFWADKIETPLLIMHNDHDGAVPWYQGIELFAALRRLGKPAWLINYNNEPHWPVKFHKKRDWQIRLQQYFDHYLKGTTPPVWLKEGIPAIQKGKTLGLETVTEG